MEVPGLHKLKRWSSRTPYSAAQCIADKSISRESAIDADMESIKSSDANLQEGESPTSQTVSPTDTPKETESPRFQALLRMTTGPRKKKNNDIKSYSHELDPKGVRSHDFWKSHSFNDLEILEALRARFNSAKEEVNNELEVFAGDLVEILERNANQPSEWLEKAEDILVLARQCTLMSPTEFRKHCEGIVQDLDDKRQVLPMGILKQLHTRMLFILTRCTRLLQFQKVNGLEEEKAPTHKSQQLNKVGPTLDRAWTATTTATTTTTITATFTKRNNHTKGKGIVAEAPAFKENAKPKMLGLSPPLPVLDKAKRVDKRKDEATSSIGSVKIEKIKPFGVGVKSATLRQEKVKTEVDSLIADRLASWRKFTTISDGFRPSPVTPDSGRADSEGKTHSRGTSKRDLQVRVDKDDGASSLTRNNSGQSSTPSVHTPSVQHRISWGYWGDQPGLVDDSYVVICRICEEEVPTVVLEEHSRVCACADRCDLKSLGLDDRLRRLAETLEKMLETCSLKTPQISASGSPDPGPTAGLTPGDGGGFIHDGLSTLNRRNSEDMLEDLHEIDAASIDGNFNPKTRFGPKSDSGMVTSSGGSLTPRSPLLASRTNSLDQVFAPDRNSVVEPGDPMQMNELADIARCVANTNPGEVSIVEYIVSCMQDLTEVLEHNKVEALTVDTFGKRIAKLIREKYQVVAEAAEQTSLDSMLDDDVEEDRFPSSKSTPLHPSAYKDRTTIADFEMIKPISRGAFGRVFLARKRTTGDLFAIKVLRKVDMIRKNAVESVQAERNILIHARNPFVVRFFYSFTCRDNLYLVMEYLNGGDLYSMLRNLGCLEEDMARVYIAELVLALEYLHSLGVVHRDLKPDNLLIAHDGHLKLSDFGLSRVGLINSTDDLSGPAAKTAIQVEESFLPGEYAKQRERRQQQSAVGTPDYLAPEILLGTGHGTPADWWSTGVILFEFLTGIPPFNAEHPQIIFDNILNRNIPWPRIPEYMSYEAQDLIDKLLKEDPNERLGAKGAKEVKGHPFFKDINWDTLARQKAAFVPSPDTAHDTSYFTSRHMWSSADGRVFPEEEFGDSSGYGSSSTGGSSGSLETRPEEGGDEYCEMTEFESTPVGKYTFSNFSFKNLSQLASINYDLLIQTGGKDPPKDLS